MQSKKKKGNLNVFWIIPGVVLALLVAGFVNSMGADLLQGLRDSQTANSYAYNITGYALEGQNTIGEWQDNLATVGVFAIIIAALMGAVAYVGVGRFGR